MIVANNPKRKSWLKIDNNCDFPIQNIPFGIFQTKALSPRVATRIGDHVIDLLKLAKLGYFDSTEIDFKGVFDSNYLNDFIALGQDVWKTTRDRIAELFDERNPELRDNAENIVKCIYNIQDVKMMLPVQIGDYTDFYSSIEHATNVGIMFRDPENALLPNWKHLPVGYHGRSSSIVVSGAEIHRPKGQTKPANSSEPVFGPSKLLDFELEMAFITGRKTKLGESISTSEAEDAIFGMVLFNDLSARDIQSWEYVPLGPFLAKNFGSVISPWIVTLDALQPFKVEGPKQDVKVLPYLEFEGKKSYDINLEVDLKPKGKVATTICKSNFKYMYWNMAQQLAHHTVNGCNINVGDMYGSGTISGSTPDSFGSMLELSWKGTKSIKLKEGGERTFIQDNDTIIMKAYCKNENLRLGFGESVVKILPAIE